GGPLPGWLHRRNLDDGLCAPPPQTTPPLMTRSGNVEKVRGMNAALATANGNALSERRPSPVHISRRQVAFALLLAVLGVIAAIYTVNAISSGEETYPALVTTSQVYDLN